MPNLDDVYAILHQWTTTPRTYTELFQAYHERTGEWVDPHRGWDQPLGELNTNLAAVGAPALSAVVIGYETNEPGAGFWACAPNVPPRPRSERQRLAVWTQILNDVRAYHWPPALPRVHPEAGRARHLAAAK